MIRVPENEGRDRTNWLLNAMAHVNTLPAAASCKWWVTLGGDRSYVNPRAFAAAVAGLPHDTLKAFMGFIWYYMGFTDNVSVSAGADQIMSRATWDAVVSGYAAGSPNCKPVSGKEDSITIGKCFMDNRVAPVDLHLIDQSGALQLNGVPLEPGPPDGSRMQWLQQAPSQGGHWAVVGNLGADRVQQIHRQYLSVYGPWGKLLTPADSARSPASQPAPTAGREYAPPPASAHSCAVSALATLRDLVDRSRTSPTAAMPITLDVVYEVSRDACSPIRSPDAPGVPRTAVEHMCFVIAPDGGDIAARAEVLRNNWGSLLHYKPGEKRNLWLVGETDDAEKGVFAVPNYNQRGGRMAALRAFAADAQGAHCRFVYFGAASDWVNPLGMANVARGMLPDVPVAVGFSLLGDKGVRGVELPAKGRVLYSRSAVDILASRVGTAACPDDTGDEADHVGVARCAWSTGIVPVHTTRFDVFNMGPGTDWAFQQPPYLLGWAMTIDQGDEGHQRIFGSYFFGCYGQNFGLLPWDSEWIQRKAMKDFW
jgi:hypothetical protein